jgi:hypothetical protein
MDKSTYEMIDASMLNDMIDKIMNNGYQIKIIVDDRISMQTRLSKKVFTSAEAGLRKGVQYIIGDTSCLPAILLSGEQIHTNPNSVYMNNLSIVKE